MSGADTLQAKARAYMLSLPGKRGIDIPEEVFDRIHNAANGITQQIWGRPPSPMQLQYLYDQGHHTPDKIREVYDSLEHPGASGVTVGEYPEWSDAYDVYKQHR